MAPSTAGQPHVLATYLHPDGERSVGQRVNGTVHLSDIPVGDQGRVYLVEPQLRSKRELDAIVQDYLAQAHSTGGCPMQGWL